MQGWKSNWLYMNINQQHALEKKKPKQFYGFKKREGLFLEDNLRWYLGIVSDNIAEKLVWGNSSKTNQGETKPFFFSERQQNMITAPAKNKWNKASRKKSNPMCNMLH